MVGESESRNSKSMSAAISFSRKSLYKELYQIVVGDPDPDGVGSGVVATTTTDSPTPASRPAPAAPRAPAAPSAPRPTPSLASRVATTAGANAEDGEAATKKNAQELWSI